MTWSAQPAIPRSALAVWVAVICVGVIIYASLQPFTGWTALPATVRFFLWQLPQRVLWNDVAFNICAYVPLGAALVLVWPRRISRKRRVGLTAVFAVILSFLMETAQMWLPTRYASTLDMLANTVGALLGALLGLLLTVSDRLTGWAAGIRERWVVSGATGDLMLMGYSGGEFSLPTMLLAKGPTSYHMYPSYTDDGQYVLYNTAQEPCKNGNPCNTYAPDNTFLLLVRPTDRLRLVVAPQPQIAVELLIESIGGVNELGSRLYDWAEATHTSRLNVVRSATITEPTLLPAWTGLWHIIHTSANPDIVTLPPRALVPLDAQLTFTKRGIGTPVLTPSGNETLSGGLPAFGVTRTVILHNNGDEWAFVGA